MNKKWIIAIVVLVALLILVVAYIDDNPNALESGERMSFNVSAGYSNLSKVTDNIKTLPRYEGYNSTVVEWMESLGNKSVVFGDKGIIIIENDDVEKVNQAPDATDVYIYNHFTAKVIESHKLGKNLTTVYYVENIDYDGYEIIGNGLA